tara:strand:+ start:4733 stop:4861 length:129 start_codon:yes stop_codon:yes gene_type:complete
LPFDERTVKTRKDRCSNTCPFKEAEINGAPTPVTDNSTTAFY